MPSSGFEGLGIGVGSWLKLYVVDFMPAGFNSVEVVAVGRQVEKGGVVKQIGENL